MRPALLAVAVLALLAVVAAGSRAEMSSRVGDARDRALPAAFWDYAVTLGVIVAVIVLALAVTLKVPLPGRRDGGFSLWQLLATVLLLGLVALAGQRIELSGLRDEGLSDTAVTAPPAEEGSRQAEDSAGERSVQIQWPVVFAAGALALLGAGAYYLRRRFDRGRLLTVQAATALSLALDESVGDLRAERDARRAVIAAYARMEHALDRHGLPRRAYEAPLEYLARVLREMRVRSDAVLALTELFERAKFSRHEIDAEMKEEAIGALLAVRDDLREEAAT